MRRFFNAFKNTSEEVRHTAPSLSPNITFSDLNYMTKRGFLSKKISQYLGLGQDDGDSFFYQSLTKSSFLEKKENIQTNDILYLSELMLKWHEKKMDIPLQIKKMNIKNDIQNAMLKAFEIYKEDLFSPPLKLNTKPEVLSMQDTDDKWRVYRDVMFAATQEKFLLITKEEVNKYKIGKLFCEGIIKERSDIPICRNLAKEHLELVGIKNSTIMSCLLVLSEAITNTIKHAEEGKMSLIQDEENNVIKFIIEDIGPGFSLSNLPNMILLAGYSTKKSLGQGFTLMMKIAKQVLLNTSSKGSTIILIFDIDNEKNGY